MNRILFLLIISFPICSFGQIENKWQPDSIYKNKKVKKIFLYLNSPKDLAEIIEFDRTGKKIRSTKYSASYNRKTRKTKSIDNIKLFKYDNQNRLIKIIDSIGKDSIIFTYEKTGKLSSSKKKIGSLIYETKHYYNPHKSTTIRKNKSQIVYHKTKEYEKDFYVKRFYGYYLEPKLKKGQSIINGTIETYTYADYEDLRKFEDNETIKNIFNENGRIIKSEVKSVFMNDRITEYELRYKYYKNGLFKSIYGFVPRWFKYEFWE